jgi:serine/tyrosine/threonine adenylyltransferase
MDILSLKFRHELAASLPGDSGENVSREVRGACYALVSPTPVRAPRLLGWSSDLATSFDLDRPSDSGPAVEVLAGNRLLEGMRPYAACYGGHQFGHWAGQLGDGRAITLGEAPDRSGRYFEFQLKGAGPTPFSRTADGRAVLRSSLREFVASEAMHWLGVPTTRALSLVTTGEEVVRDMFYDGHPRPEPGAIVCRVAPSFLRFGSFEIFASRGETALLRQLVDYLLSHHFPQLGEPGPAAYLAWFSELCARTAALMANWMRVGFVHGVMNTDNLSALGLTIDYGPFGWLDDFNPFWTPNTTDLPGRRYCYGRQPAIALWNLAQLARALAPLVPGEGEALGEALDGYRAAYERESARMMAGKLGLEQLMPGDEGLVEEMHALLIKEETDMTLFFRRLADFVPGKADVAVLSDAFYREPSSKTREGWSRWLATYGHRLGKESRSQEERKRAMDRVNPLYLPRNYLLQEAIDRAEQGDSSRLETLLEVLRRPYEEQPGREAFAAKRPDWARNRAGCSTLSCSS